MDINIELVEGLCLLLVCEWDQKMEVMVSDAMTNQKCHCRHPKVDGDLSVCWLKERGTVPTNPAG